VASFGPACGGKDVTTTPSTGTQTDPGTATGPTSGQMSSTSVGPTTTGTGTTTGELPDCHMYDGDDVTCSSMIACLYLLNQKVCIVRCQNFHDQASCEMQEYCYWEADGCYLAV
jgi:hypothetical protein